MKPNIIRYQPGQNQSWHVEAIREKLRTIDVNRLTFIEALLKLNELLQMLG